jgi:hypothetical protein
MCNNSRTFFNFFQLTVSLYSAPATGEKITRQRLLVRENYQLSNLALRVYLLVRWECNCLCVKVEQIVHFQMKLNNKRRFKCKM